MSKQEDVDMWARKRGWKVEKSFYHVDWGGKTWDHVTTLKFSVTTILKGIKNIERADKHF